MNNPYGPPGGGYPPQGGYPQQGYGPPQQGYGPTAYQTPPPQQAPHAPLPNPEGKRRAVGLVLYIILIVVGLVLNVVFYLAAIFGSKHPSAVVSSMLTGFICATAPLAIYLFLPAIIDRFDPEPWWCLAMAFFWGAIVATGFAGLINTIGHAALSSMMREKTATVITVSVIAPICEEFFKGLAVLGTFYFLRREFDGVVDGIIYATFIALGFACVENIQYYGQADAHGGHALTITFFLRGVLAPWGHPLYTSMTGIGFGVARESDKAVVRFLGPVVGYMAAVTLHAIWNFVPTVFGGAGFLVAIVLWLIFVACFGVMLIVLVARKGKTIRDNLRDEVLIGNLSQEEVDLICSPVGRLRCTFSWRGKQGRDFIGAGARLALSKWHTARAMRGSKRTISADFIVPMRNEIKRLRGELLARMPRRA